MAPTLARAPRSLFFAEAGNPRVVQRHAQEQQQNEQDNDDDADDADHGGEQERQSKMNGQERENSITFATGLDQRDAKKDQRGTARTVATKRRVKEDNDPDTMMGR